jgi:hypothetical protein
MNGAISRRKSWLRCGTHRLCICKARVNQASPQSPWTAALLTGLGLEYYNTAYYSRALDAWALAWALAKDATDAHGKAIGDRAAGELAYMYARLGCRRIPKPGGNL